MQPQPPGTSPIQATGSKTLFVGNLSFSVEQTDVYVTSIVTLHVYNKKREFFDNYLTLWPYREDFFKDAGEIVSMRFSVDREGAFKGFGHVEFATVEAAQKVYLHLLSCFILYCY